MARKPKRKTKLSSTTPTRRGAVERAPIAFRLPVALVAQVDQRAEIEGVNRTWMVETLLRQALTIGPMPAELKEARDDRTLDLFA